MPTTSLWSDTVHLPKFPALRSDLKVDVVVVGGGITGVTAAYLLKQAGKTVALLERSCCGAVNTAHTSAHLTYITDHRVKKLVEMWGPDHGRAVLEAGQAALAQIEKNVQVENIACGFQHVPGYLHASLVENKEESKELQEEARLATDLGFEAKYLDSVPLFQRPGVCFPNQARFHPLLYLAGLLQRIPGQGSHVFEHTEAQEFSDNLEVRANGCTVRSDFVVIATDVPLMGNAHAVSAALFQTKIAPYTSYVVGAKLPSGQAPDALFWDTTDPYYFLRLERRAGIDHVIFGGQDHKTGQDDDPGSRFQKLEAVLKKHVPQAQVTHRWSGQVVEAVDGLPYIGETAPKQFVATGFSGNGLTFGTLGAVMACDAACERPNPWQELFDVRRKKLAGLWNYLRENADYPYYLVKDRLAKEEGSSVQDLESGQGKILNLDGQRVAAYRDTQGKVITLSAVCPHLGCLVHWNNVESTWDCPCHGSRFQATILSSCPFSSRIRITPMARARRSTPGATSSCPSTSTSRGSSSSQ
jgi:glycine/D-amino acid oxidase-like deaminating enzyme